MQLVIHKPFTHFTGVWENSNWCVVFLVGFVILFKADLTSVYFKPVGKEELDRELLKL